MLEYELDKMLFKLNDTQITFTNNHQPHDKDHLK